MKGAKKSGRVVVDEQKRLEQELADVLAEMKRLDKKLENEPDYDLGEGDPTILEWEMNYALRQDLSKRRESLERALGRVKRGSYGMCERCGGAIHPERLQILPHTTLCITCARAR